MRTLLNYPQDHKLPLLHLETPIKYLELRKRPLSCQILHQHRYLFFFELIRPGHRIIILLISIFRQIATYRFIIRDTASIVSLSKGLPPKDCIPNLKKTFSLYKYNGERLGPSKTTSLIELEPISIIPIRFKIFKMFFFFFCCHSINLVEHLVRLSLFLTKRGFQ